MRVSSLLVLALLACGAAAQGSLGSPCQNGNCQSGLVCLAEAGISVCMQAGGLGEPCLSDGSCDNGLSCSSVEGSSFCVGASSAGGFPSSSSSGSIPNGANGGMCNTDGSCNTGLTCMSVNGENFCVDMSISEGGDGGDGGDSGGDPLPAGTIGGACESDGTCNTGLLCNTITIAGVSASVCMPAAQALANCSNSCVNGQQCLFGLCVALPPSCAQPCLYGATCTYGVCIPPANPNCDDCSGECVPSFAPNQPPVCLQSNTGGSPSKCTSTSGCTGTDVCQMGVCVSFGLAGAISSLSTDVQSQLQQLLSQVGAASSYTSFVPAGNLSAMVANGGLSAQSGAVFQLSTSLTESLNLNFPPNAGTAAMQLQAGQSFNIPFINASANNAQLFIGAGASMSASALQIAAGGSMTLSIGGTSGQQSVAMFSQLQISGSLNVVGGMNSVLQFPSSGTGITASSTAQVNINGGVSLQGNAQSVPINIVGSASNGASAAQNAVANIQGGATFSASGNVLGSSATLNVAGQFQFTGSFMQPTLHLQSGGSAQLAAPSGSGQQLSAGNISFAETGNVHFQINATSAAAGANVFIQTLLNCPPSATIQYQLSGSVKDSALSTGFRVMNYGVYTSSSSFLCNINVCDDDGCTVVDNPNVDSASARRLLDSGSATATWGATSLTVKSSNSASAATASAVCVFFAAIFALLQQRLF